MGCRIMAFALRHKETGELWKGKNLRNHKLYATEATARNALSGIITYNNGIRTILEMSPVEYNDLIHEGLAALKQKVEAAREAYRKTDPLKDRAASEVARDEYLLVSRQLNDALVKARKRVKDMYCKWEVVEL